MYASSLVASILKRIISCLSVLQNEDSRCEGAACLAGNRDLFKRSLDMEPSATATGGSPESSATDSDSGASSGDALDAGALCMSM